MFLTSEDSLRLRSGSCGSRPNRGDDCEEGASGTCWQNSPSISAQSKSAMGECWWLRATRDQMLFLPTTCMTNTHETDTKLELYKRQHETVPTSYHPHNLIQTISLINQHSGSRTQQFNTANSKAHHCTRSSASSIHLPSSQHISIRSILLIN
jgi:hypothetical protein